MKKGLVSVLLACACLGQQSVPNTPAQYRQTGDREGRLKTGDPAADFDLKMLHSESRVRLSAFKGQKPVALVFGSFT
jgi:hypothetical protein